ncbi:MAG: copper chaperone PCu(A)C [Anaerolineae bacterium]|nr:copper chaperone PCu(A)C [Anaerolineae bacterium]
MVKRIMFLMFLLTLVVGTTIQAQETGGIVVTGAWARPTAARMEGTGGMNMGEATAEPMGGMNMGEATAEPMGGMNMSSGAVSAAYMQIENQTGADIRLVGAASPVAGIVEVHEVSMVDNVMQMRPVEGGILIPAGESAALQPGGYHIMMLNLQHDIYAGDAIAVTLTFQMADGMNQDVVVGAVAQDEASAASDIVVTGAWARPTAVRMEGMGEATAEPMGEMNMGEATAEPMGGMNMGSGAVSAAYLTVVNNGAAAERLVAARTDAAGLVEIHEVSMVDNVMQMRPVQGGIEVPSGAAVELKPGGYHVMLMNLPQDFYVGDAISLTLVFESGLEITVGVPVIEQQ